MLQWGLKGCLTTVRHVKLAPHSGFAILLARPSSMIEVRRAACQRTTNYGRCKELDNKSEKMVLGLLLGGKAGRAKPEDHFCHRATVPCSSRREWKASLVACGVGRWMTKVKIWFWVFYREEKHDAQNLKIIFAIALLLSCSSRREGTPGGQKSGTGWLDRAEVQSFCDAKKVYMQLRSILVSF